jgi:hypothetical protein
MNLDYIHNGGKMDQTKRTFYIVIKADDKAQTFDKQNLETALSHYMKVKSIDVFLDKKDLMESIDKIV